jgi:hypothetical protein
MPAWKTEWTVTKRKMKLARDDVRGGLPVLSALNLLTLCYCIVYCVVLSAVDCLKVHRCVQTVQCAVWHRVFFEVLVLFTGVYVWHSTGFVCAAWLSVYDRSEDGRRITEGGTSSKTLPSSSLPGTFIVFPPRIGLLSGGRMDGRSLGVVKNFHSIQI